jgi:hypothetical protein
VTMPRSERPVAMRSPMRLTNLTGVESWSGTGLMVAAIVAAGVLRNTLVATGWRAGEMIGQMK